MSYDHILFHAADGIARITLNRPERLNSFNDAMHAEVRDALDNVRGDASARVLLLTGAGRGFCAGQDLGDRAVAPGGAPVDLGVSIGRNYKPLILGLRTLPMPVVCAVNGVAAGAGANLALACDVVGAARTALRIHRDTYTPTHPLPTCSSSSPARTSSPRRSRVVQRWRPIIPRGWPWPSSLRGPCWDRPRCGVGAHWTEAWRALGRRGPGGARPARGGRGRAPPLSDQLRLDSHSTTRSQPRSVHRPLATPVPPGC